MFKKRPLDTRYLGFSDTCDDKTAELALREVDDQSIYFIAT